MTVAATSPALVQITSIRATQQERHLGAVLSSSAALISALNSASVLLDTWTPTVGGAYTDWTYQAPDASTGTTYSDTGSTAGNLADDMRDQDSVTRWFNISTAGVLTAKYPGDIATLTNTTNVTWAHTYTGAEGSDIGVGRAVIQDSIHTGEAGAVPVMGLATSSSFSAQVKTYAVTSAASALFRAFVKWNGKIYESATTVHNTDTPTTIDDLVTAINAVMPAESVIASRSSNDLLLTSEVEGQSFEAWIGVSGSGSAEAVPTYTTGSEGATASDYAAKFLGILTRHASVNDSSGDAVLHASATGVVCQRGQIVVANSQGVSFGQQVFVSIASATRGQMFNANSTDYIPLPLSRARWVRDLGGGYAVVELL